MVPDAHKVVLFAYSVTPAPVTTFPGIYRPKTPPKFSVGAGARWSIVLEAFSDVLDTSPPLVGGRRRGKT